MIKLVGKKSMLLLINRLKNSRKIEIIKGTIVSQFFRLVKIKPNEIIVDNYYGKGFGDNPKYIIKELVKIASEINIKLDIVWIVNGKSSIDPDIMKYYGIRTVNLHSLKMYYELCRSAVWIDNVKALYKPIKRQTQFYMQSWHGGIALKQIEKAAEKNLPKSYVSDSKRDSSQTDLILSNSKWMTKNIRNNFWYNGEIAETGFPRDDIFFENNTDIKNKVKRFYNISADTEIILYAPTFRQYMSIDDQVKLFDIDEKRIVKAFENRFHKKFVVLKRMHPNISEVTPIVENEYCKNGSAYPDMQELLVTSFAEISDFSSSIFDFMLANNRIFLYAPDYDSYISNERNLCFDIKNDLPFPLADSVDNLCKNILNYDENKMGSEVSNLKDSFDLKDDGHASERVAKIILRKLENEL